MITRIHKINQLIISIFNIVHFLVPLGVLHGPIKKAYCCLALQMAISLCDRSKSSAQCQSTIK